jgi:hypothetical protein
MLTLSDALEFGFGLSIDYPPTLLGRKPLYQGEEVWQEVGQAFLSWQRYVAQDGN